jgi:hypothetical protein
LSPRSEDALVFAARLHAGHVRKGTTIPYVSHVLGVAGLALEHGAGEDEAIAFLLNDTMEDATGDPEVIRIEIRRRYGPAVLAIVDGCTDSRSKPTSPFRERKEAYIAKLPEASPSTRLVSAANKLYNARAIQSDLPGDRRRPLGALHRRPGRHSRVLPPARGDLPDAWPGSAGRGVDPHRVGNRAPRGRRASQPREDDGHIEEAKPGSGSNPNPKITQAAKR